MRVPKVLAALLIAVFSLAVGAVPFGAYATAVGADPVPVLSAVSASVEAGGPGQSLGELLGAPAQQPGAKGGIVSVWALAGDTVVKAPAYVDANEKIDLKGHTLTVYGSLTINGDSVSHGSLVIDGGKLIIKKNNSYKNTGNLYIRGGLLVMTKSADYVETEQSVIADGYDGTGSLTAGSVKVYGQFMQLNDYSPYSYNETGTHTTILSGTNKLVIFKTPVQSGFRNLTLSGVSFTAADTDVPVTRYYRNPNGGTLSQDYVYHTNGTFLSLKKSLTSNYSITVPNLYYLGVQGAYTLTVTGNLIVPAGGSLNVTGNISATGVYDSGSLTLSSGKTIAAANSFSLTSGGILNLSVGGIATKAFYASQGTVSAAGISGASITLGKYTGSAISISGSPVNFSGDLGGRSLTVSGSLVIPQGATLTPNGGVVNVSGNIDAVGSLVIAKSGDLVYAGNDFITESSSSSFTAGTLEVGGMFRQVHGAAFGAGTGFHARLLGLSSAWGTVFDDPDTAWFTNVTFPSRTDISAGSVISIRGNLAADLSVPASALLYFSGSLNGHRLSAGSLTIPAGQTLTIGSGRLDVYGDMDMLGTLDMQDAGGAVVVGGTFTAEGGNSWGHLKQGYLALEGNFLQKGAYGTPSAKSFCPDSTFNALLLGTGPQSENFESPADPGDPIDGSTDGSWFYSLVSCNTGVASAPAGCYGPFTASGTKLADISVSAGGAPQPLDQDFEKNTLSYGVALPVDATSARLSFTSANANEAIAMTGASHSEGVTDGDVSITPDGTRTVTHKVTLEVFPEAEMMGNISGDPFSTTYTVTLHRVPLLAGLSLNYALGNDTVSKPFPLAGGATAFSVDVPVDADSIIASATPNGSGGVVTDYTGNDGVVDPGTQKEIKVQATAGAVQATYTITVRKPMLSGLNLEPARALDAPFSPDSSVVSSVTIPYGWPSVTLVPVGNYIGTGDGVTFEFYEMTNGGEALLPDGVIALSQGQTRHIAIHASYNNGTETFEETYEADVKREQSDNANLKSLGASAGYLSPAFASSTAAYTLLIPETVSTVTLSPAVEDVNSTYKIDALSKNTPKALTLPLNGSATVEIAVTALRGNTKTYTVTVRRVPMLSVASAKPVYSGYPSLSPGGTNRLTVSYSVSLPCTVKLEVKKGTKWYTVLSRAEASPGAKTWAWNGMAGGSYLPSGLYTFRVMPYYSGSAGASKSFTVKILSKPAVSVTSINPSTFKANGANKLQTVVKWTILTDAKVDVVNSAGRTVETLYTAACRPPATLTLYWDGRDASGSLVAAGKYTLKVTCGGAAAVYKAFTVKR